MTGARSQIPSQCLILPSSPFYFIGNIDFPYPNIIIHTGWELAIELSGKYSAFCNAQLEMFDLTRVKRKINWQFPSQPYKRVTHPLGTQLMLTDMYQKIGIGFMTLKKASNEIVIETTRLERSGVKAGD